jgi:hypothetical protein
MKTWMLAIMMAVTAGCNAGEAADEGVNQSAIAGPNHVCGGIAGFTCAQGEYCDFAPNAECGFADDTGVCRTKPFACPHFVGVPVCGCDGKFYNNVCEANVAGVSVVDKRFCQRDGGGGVLPIRPPVAKKCVRGGCSGQLCFREGTSSGISTCEFRPEYACFQRATCEEQANGECGFTQTEALTECLANAHF